MAGEPCIPEALGLDSDRLGQPEMESLRLLDVPRDERLPEVEDDRAELHSLSSFLTSPQGRVLRI
jgi:hypothetical protein